VRLGLFAIRLHEHLNRGERVTQFMCHARSHLAHRGHLIGTQHLPLALLELFDDPLDLRHQPLHLLVHVVQIATFGQDHGGQLLTQFPSGILDAHAQLLDRTPQAARRPIPQQDAGNRADTADTRQPPGHPGHDLAIGRGGMLDLQGMVFPQLAAQRQGLGFQDRHRGLHGGWVCSFDGREACFPVLIIPRKAVLQLAHQPAFFLRVRQLLGLGEQRSDPLMEGLHFVTALPLHRGQLIHDRFKRVVELAADDVSSKNLGRGGLLAVEVHRGGGA
jgi:hypothetical protein